MFFHFPPKWGGTAFLFPPKRMVFRMTWGGTWGGTSPPIGGEIRRFPPQSFSDFQVCSPPTLGGNWILRLPPKMLGFPPKILASSPPKGEFPPKMLFVPPQLWGGTLPSVPPQLGGELTKKQLWGGTWGGN